MHKEGRGEWKITNLIALATKEDARSYERSFYEVYTKRGSFWEDYLVGLDSWQFIASGNVIGAGSS
eukprot:9355228-Ditylum_brightwellii.AAC.1